MPSILENTTFETEAANKAIRFINSTSSHIFLTGKAGTGKTTFLKNLSGRTHKQFAIVAPTGIAALNAGGVTIHAQFLFPFGIFIPDAKHAGPSNSESTNYYTATALARKHPLNSARKQVLRSIDLLVIDEVSMLRADLLDAIDYRLKAAKGNFRQRFGGVQLLLIGDLYQLPPVVKGEDAEQLRPYYKSPWFFEAGALKEEGFVYIELDKIFRQHDDTFINLLNNLRNNATTHEDIDELNKYYKPPAEIQNLREVITLTTHNYKADELNLKALMELNTSSHILEAEVDGEFPESMYPVLRKLELKVGAQVMFTKNDVDKIYFNGKIATVTSISGDKIEVSMAGTHALYILKREVWENKKYTVNQSTQELDAEVIGTFQQYPVKLAWAITVHKSQGLTFDKAIIDVGQAFADGQVYVALSRLRSLDGLILRTRLDPNVITTDKQIVSFTEDNNRPAELDAVMKDKQRHYIAHLILTTFHFDALLKEITFIHKASHAANDFEEQSMKPALAEISRILLAEDENTEKFRRQLSGLLETGQQLQLLERIKKGSDYYKSVLIHAVKILLGHLEEIKNQKRVKAYVTSLTDLDQLFAKKLEEVDKALYLTESILDGRDQFDFAALANRRTLERNEMLTELKVVASVVSEKVKKSKVTRASKKEKKGEPSTYDITLRMLEDGHSIEGIAKERGLVVGTIDGHLARAVEEGRISISKFMSEDHVLAIAAAVKVMPEDFTSKDLFIKLKGEFNYGQLRAVMSHLGVKSMRQKHN